ncbi:MAG: DUF4419 domain-containing protein [Candidatus Melainabacteria bacterium]|nr:DUF4419 domain-containing protein [Candidatus Melainabacteria bacterium]
MKLKTSAGVTFRVDDVETVRTPLEQCKTRDSITRILNCVQDADGSPVLACSGYNSEVVANSKSHALIGAVHIAFAEHRPLVLSPDAIWITILQGLAMHVHVHSEELRHLFVSHTGRKEIKITVDMDPSSPESAWDQVISQFADCISVEVDGSSSLISDFSTTGVVERLVSQVCLLDVFESYFEYILYTGCGFPEITLTGTEDDWVNLRNKIELLERFEVDFWLPHLREIADQFCRAMRGDIDLYHWQNMYKQTERYGPDLINGWIVKLIPYLQNKESGTWDYLNPLLRDADQESRSYVREGATIDQLPAGMSVVPFRCFDKNGQESFLEMIGGFVGIEQNVETSAVQPKIGWAIRNAKPREWQLLSSTQIRKEASLSSANLSAVAAMLIGSTRYTVALPKEFFEFYKQCDGLSLEDKNGITWTLRPFAEVEAILVDVAEDDSFDGIHYDPNVARDDGSIFMVNQRWLRVGDASDGSAVLFNGDHNRRGFADVRVVDASGTTSACFFGLRNFVAHLAEIFDNDTNG